jgi:hypothetical protein
MESHDIPFDEFEKLRQATEEVHDAIITLARKILTNYLAAAYWTQGCWK